MKKEKNGIYNVLGISFLVQTSKVTSKAYKPPIFLLLYG